MPTAWTRIWVSFVDGAEGAGMVVYLGGVFQVVTSARWIVEDIVRENLLVNKMNGGGEVGRYFLNAEVQRKGLAFILRSRLQPWGTVEDVGSCALIFF